MHVTGAAPFITFVEKARYQIQYIIIIFIIIITLNIIVARCNETLESKQKFVKRPREN